MGSIPLMDAGWRERLRDEIAAKGTNMKSLSKAADLGETFVRDILERSRVPSIENAQKICEKLDVSYEAIFGNGGLKGGGVVELNGIEYARLPVYDIRWSAGPGSDGGDEIPIDHYLVSLNLLRATTDAPVGQIAIFQSDGDSMASTINNRDWVFVDRRRTRLTNPGIYALMVDGDRLLKRAQQHMETGAVTLISDNPAYRPQQQTIKRPERLTVIGRVFMSIRRH